MSFIVELIKKMAVPMTPPAAYGPFHLIFFAAGLAVSALLAYHMRNHTEKATRRVLLAVGLFLLCSEVFKQAFQYYAIGYDRYPFGIFPFHLCSTPMYLSIAAGFMNPGRLREGLFNYIGTFAFLGGFATFFEPSGINHPFWAQTIHSYLWHMLLIFLGFYLFATGHTAAKNGQFKDAFFVFLSLAITAFLINTIFYNASGGSINMFFIGPAHATIIVFRAISMRFGWYVSTPLFIGCMTLGAFLAFSLARSIRKRFANKARIGKIAL